MMGRPYIFSTPNARTGSGELGLLFLSYQRDLDTFARTQVRLDETDDLMAYVSPTASASFLILPGFDDTHPLGSSL